MNEKIKQILEILSNKEIRLLFTDLRLEREAGAEFEKIKHLYPEEQHLKRLVETTKSLYNEDFKSRGFGLVERNKIIKVL